MPFKKKINECAYLAGNSRDLILDEAAFLLRYRGSQLNKIVDVLSNCGHPTCIGNTVHSTE
jgi:hypothetical protein